jgi:hypothetical protein
MKNVTNGQTRTVSQISDNSKSIMINLKRNFFILTKTHICNCISFFAMVLIFFSHKMSSFNVKTSKKTLRHDSFFLNSTQCSILCFATNKICYIIPSHHMKHARSVGFLEKLNLSLIRPQIIIVFV